MTCGQATKKAIKKASKFSEGRQASNGTGLGESESTLRAYGDDPEIERKTTEGEKEEDWKKRSPPALPACVPRIGSMLPCSSMECIKARMCIALWKYTPYG